MLHYLHLQGDLPGQPMRPKPSPAKNACANSIKIVASHVRSKADKADKAAAFCGKDITSKSGITFVTALQGYRLLARSGKPLCTKLFGWPVRAIKIDGNSRPVRGPFEARSRPVSRRGSLILKCSF